MLKQRTMHIFTTSVYCLGASFCLVRPGYPKREPPFYNTKTNTNVKENIPFKRQRLANFRSWLRMFFLFLHERLQRTIFVRNILFEILIFFLKRKIIFFIEQKEKDFIKHKTRKIIFLKKKNVEK